MISFSLDKMKFFMNEALVEAKKAFDADEIPIGAVLVKDNTIIARAYNLVETHKSILSHAELLVIKEASANLNAKYLNDCTLFVTIEPCLMCSGAILWSKIPKVVYGAMEPKSGALGSLYSLQSDKRTNHQFEVVQGICEEECEQLMKDFFKMKRWNESN